eukprot:TRINITY_DN20316_c0_g1_i1.p1 TRINITY_DN20316_c0_g1~~TRINITY_DN20316_c0_g1_i1.p1  ORF type:complete len:226 (-),score=23.74 TRINITY_DN20316_c0_g1_i1:175-765(-)
MVCVRAALAVPLACAFLACASADEPATAMPSFRGLSQADGVDAGQSAGEEVGVEKASVDETAMYAEAVSLPALPNATASDSGVSCSEDDMTLINAKGGGHSSGSFPEIVGRCGKNGYSMWSGFHEDWMSKCIRKEVAISESCASCYVRIGKYAASNCKWACLWGSWCRKSCLTCNEKVRTSVNSCVGHESPQPDQC